MTLKRQPELVCHPEKAILMKAFVYQGTGKTALEDRPKPKIIDPTDAIVRMTKTTICGTDLYIIKRDVPT